LLNPPIWSDHQDQMEPSGKEPGLRLVIPHTSGLPLPQASPSKPSFFAFEVTASVDRLKFLANTAILGNPAPAE